MSLYMQVQRLGMNGKEIGRPVLRPALGGKAQSFYVAVLQS